MSVAFSSDLGALYTDYYQGLAARHQLLNVNDNIINRQYRIERQCTESDVVNTKDGHAFVIFNGGHRKFDKGKEKIYDKSNNLGFVLGYEKSCNENLTLGAFAGYGYVSCKQEGNFLYVRHDNVDEENYSISRDDSKANAGLLGFFSRYSANRLTVSGVVSGNLLRYKVDDATRNQFSKRNGYIICGSGDIRYNMLNNEGFAFGPLVAMSYYYSSQGKYCFFDENGAGIGRGTSYEIESQIGKTLNCEVGAYGIADFCTRNIPIRMYCALTFSKIMKKHNHDTDYHVQMEGAARYNMTIRRTSEPSSYINVKLGVTSAVSESIDINADVKGSFAKDYYDVMGAVGMSYNF